MDVRTINSTTDAQIAGTAGFFGRCAIHLLTTDR
jgi:hypothetical protein